MLIHHLIWIRTGSGDCSDHLDRIRTGSGDCSDHLGWIRTGSGDCSDHLGWIRAGLGGYGHLGIRKKQTNIIPAVDFDILGIIKWPEF